MYEDKILNNKITEDDILKKRDYKKTIKEKVNFESSISNVYVERKSNINIKDANIKEPLKEKSSLKKDNSKSNSLNKIQEKIRIAKEIKKLKNGGNDESDGAIDKVSKLISKVFNVSTFLVIGTSLLILVPIIMIIVVVIGMGLLIAGTSYNADDKDLNEAYKYVTELRIDLEEDMLNLANRYDIAYYYKNGTYVSYPEVIFEDEKVLAYLASKYDDFKFRRIKNDIKDIFNATHSYTKVTRTRTRKDNEGNVISRTRIVSIYYVEEDFETYLLANDLLTDDELEHYNAFKEQSGTYTRQVLGNPFSEEAWQVTISSPYGYRILDATTGKEFHEGLDLAMPIGTEVKACMSGKIQLKQDANGYGNYITITNGDKMTLYGHLSSYKSGLRNGDMVNKGDVIGYVGTTGRSTGPHLHLGYKFDGEWYNPAFYLIE